MEQAKGNKSQKKNCEICNRSLPEFLLMPISIYDKRKVCLPCAIMKTMKARKDEAFEY